MVPDGGETLRSNKSEGTEQGFDRLLNIAAGVVALVAGALGAVGVGTGIAAALLREFPVAVLTGIPLIGVAVLAGVVASFTRGNARVADHRRTAVLCAVLVVALAGIFWLRVAQAFFQYSSFADDTTGGWTYAGLMVAAVTAGAVLVLRLPRLRARTAVTMAALFLLGSAMLGIITLISTGLRVHTQPQLSASVKTAGDTAELSITMSAYGMSASDHYELTGWLTGEPGRPADTVQLLRTWAGPGSDGTLTYTTTVTVRLTPGRPWAIVTARLDSDPSRPQAPPVTCDPAPETGFTCTAIRLPV
ncbi:hypothetical protein [Amycolatopsis pigmentata]|uniref:Uncharacterized protein n=1 Tax=Amycolatopsis pigmentata TaxID=450801 RepID=A0ABW5FXN7_9PSEU